MPETYKFEYKGAIFSITSESDVADSATTTDPPNLRVIEGSWPTWRLEVDWDVPGIGALRILKSTNGAGGPHPHGNLTPDESATFGHMLMISSTGYLYKIPTGYGAIGRLYTPEEWSAQLAEWEATLPSADMTHDQGDVR